MCLTSYVNGSNFAFYSRPLFVRAIPTHWIDTELRYRAGGCPVLDAFQGRGSWSDGGKEYENCMECRGRSAGVFRQRMGPAGSQCVARQFYVRANAMGGARRYCSGRGYRPVAVG